MHIYKKLIIAAFGLSLVSFGVHAAEQLSGAQLNVQPKIDQKIVEDMNATSLRFCNDGLTETGIKPRLYVTSRPGQIQKVCAMFFNNLEKEMNFYVGFSKATKNKYDERLCDNDTSDNTFSRLVRQDFAAMKIGVKAHEQSYRNFNITVPKNTTGDIIGCLSYTIDGWYTHETWQVFGVVIRKTAPIRIAVTWEVYNFWRWDDMKDGYTINKTSILKVVAGVLGIWIVISIVQISSKKKEKHAKKK